MSGGEPSLQDLTSTVLQALEAVSAARETALAASRQTVRRSANAIRALHRGDTTAADGLIAEARRLLSEAEDAVRDHPEIRWVGFVHDAEKEYAEACITRAVLQGGAVPPPQVVSVTGVAWLHGVAEAIGELRRAVLDALRKGDFAAAEALFARMDDMFEVLVSVDYPDAMTQGLRRATDATRGILERTRADVTMALVQRR